MGGKQSTSTSTKLAYPENSDFAYKCEYQWEIKKFEELNYLPGNCLNSKRLKTNIKGETDEWDIVLYPSGINERTSNYISVWLKRISLNERLVHFTCELLNSKNESCVKKTTIKKLSLESVLGWPAFCSRDYALKENILIDRSLTIKCTLQIYDDIFLDKPDVKEEDPYMESKLSELSENFDEWLQLQKNCDVIFEFDTELIPAHKRILSAKNCDVIFEFDTELISAHKMILSARSPVFRAMFDSELHKKEENIIITDIDKELFRIMLLFIYSGKLINLDSDCIIKLYYAADKYELISLKQMCSKVLINNFSEENAVKILILAHNHSDEILKKKYIEYIVKNIIDVQKRDDWLEVIKSLPNLANDVFKHLAN